MKYLLLFSFLITSWQVHAKKLCEIYEWMSCPDAFGASRSTTGQSLPNTTSSGLINPSTIHMDRGAGLETLTYRGKYDFSLVAGTGVVGSAFALGSQEGTFFGNSPYEDEPTYLERRVARNRYESSKINAMVAVNLWRNKKKNAKYKINLGLIGKYNQKTSKYHGGVGISAKLGVFSFGVARIRDDYKENADVGQGQYYTNSVSLGMQFSSAAVDWSEMKNYSYEESRVRLLTATFFFKKVMLTWGQRMEEGFLDYYDRDLKALNPEKRNIEGFLGVQYSAHKHLILGLFSNYYLSDEWTFGLTLFY